MPVKHIPEGFHSATPYLIVSDGERTVEFCKKAFDAEVTELMRNLEGRVSHAEFRIGDSMIMLGEHDVGKLPEGTFPPVSIYLYVPDADASFARAIDAGAKVIMPLSNKFYGNRDGGVQYPEGVTWWIASRVEELTPEQLRVRHAEEMKRRAQANSGAQ